MEGIGEQYVCYDDSNILILLSRYPYIQLCVVLLFLVLCIVAVVSSKRAEQNRVWVGLSKETAHQLGTPISSLMACLEILKEKYPEDEFVNLDLLTYASSLESLEEVMNHNNFKFVHGDICDRDLVNTLFKNEIEGIYSSLISSK